LKDQNAYENPKKYLWIDGKLKDITAVKSFVKDENYPEYKHARSINSRTDAFKCLCGHLFSIVDEKLFKLKWFIKKVPVHERASLMKNTFNMSMPGDATDHSSFEAAFTPAVMSIEHELYRHVWRNLTHLQPLTDFILRTLIGQSVCHFRWYTVTVLARRMSGEMNTSSGNGFMNLMAVLFLCYINGDPNPVGFVEGDDGIFQSTAFPTPPQFAQLGFTVKMDHQDKINEASFCGLIFDENEEVVVCNPMWVVATLGWVSRQYCKAKDATLKALLRCKALSYAHQFPGHPIITSICRYTLRMTSGIDVRPVLQRGLMSQWEREKLLDAIADRERVKSFLARDVSLSTRVLVEKVFKVPLATQLFIERIYNEKNDLSPMVLPTTLFPDQWVHYAGTYLAPEGTFVPPTQKARLFPACPFPIKDIT